MYKKILLPVDLNAEATWERSAEVARELAKPSGAEVHVLCVLPEMGLPVVGSYFKEGFEEHALGELKEGVKSFIARFFTDGTKVKGHVAHGAIYKEILRAADALEADLIIVASHRPEMKDYFLGPNAARVARYANQSVLVVRQ